MYKLVYLANDLKIRFIPFAKPTDTIQLFEDCFILGYINDKNIFVNLNLNDCNETEIILQLLRPSNYNVVDFSRARRKNEEFSL
jgi:hypothetical protein